MVLHITVSDPEKHGGSSVSASAYVDFKVHVTTDEPRFTNSDFFVRRRYRDFCWLRNQLCQSHPGAIVPPLPGGDSLITDDRFSEAFIQRRMAMLEFFLRRIAAHETLSSSAGLVTFLEAKVWELQTAKNASSSSSWSLRIAWDGPQASILALQDAFRAKQPSLAPGEVEKLRSIDKLRDFSRNYEAGVSAAALKHQCTVRQLADKAHDLGQLGPAIQLLSQSETELSLPFTHMAATLDQLKQLSLKQVQSEHISGLGSLLSFHSGMASALKEAVANCDASLLQKQKAESNLEARRDELLRAQIVEATGHAPSSMSGMLGKLSGYIYASPDEGAADSRMGEAQRDAASAQSRWEAIHASIHDEVDKYHRSADVDFSQGLKAYVAQQIEFEDAQQQQWRQLLDVFNEVETVPCGALLPSPSSPAATTSTTGRCAASASDAEGR